MMLIGSAQTRLISRPDQNMQCSGRSEHAFATALLSVSVPECVCARDARSCMQGPSPGNLSHGGELAGTIDAAIRGRSNRSGVNQKDRLRDFAMCGCSAQGRKECVDSCSACASKAPRCFVQPWSSFKSSKAEA